MKFIRTLAVATAMALGTSAWAGTMVGPEGGDRESAEANCTAIAWAPASTSPIVQNDQRLSQTVRREIGMQTVPMQSGNQTGIRGVLPGEWGPGVVEDSGGAPRKRSAPLVVPLPSAAPAGLIMLSLFVVAWFIRRLRSAISLSAKE